MSKKSRKALSAFLAAVLAVSMNGGVLAGAEGEEILINETNFPDAEFRNDVSDIADTDKNGSLSREEIESVTELGLGNISDLTGIGYFTELESLYCIEMSIQKLDLRGNTKLRELNISDTSVSELDLSGNTMLNDLSCKNTLLTELDLSNNTELEYLFVSDNILMDIKLGDKPKLKKILGTNNYLEEIDLSGCPNLETVQIDKNILTKIDVSNNPKLKYLNVANNAFKTLDVLLASGLEELVCSDNMLTELDLSANTALARLECSNNSLTSINVSGCPSLMVFFCDNNKLKTLDVSNNPELLGVSCKNNNLTSLDLSNNPNLSTLLRPAEENKYKIGLTDGEFDLSLLPAGFDISKASDWKGADLDGSVLKNFTGIDGEEKVTYTYDLNNGTYEEFTLLYGVSKAESVAVDEDNFPDPAFRKYISDNFDIDGDGVISTEENDDVVAIDVTNMNISDVMGIEHFPSLERLTVSSNYLTSLDVSANTELLELYCDNNDIYELDLSNNKKLTALMCDSNDLTALDVKANVKLQELYCNKNMIDTLDVSANDEIMMLFCSSNGMTELKLGNNLGLWWLMCNDNKITELDFSGCPFLSALACSDNCLTSLDLSNNPDITGSIEDFSMLISINNEYDIGSVGSEFDLKKLPGKFDVSKASDWQGAECENGILKNFTGIDGENKITYSYDIGNAFQPTETFTLTYNTEPEPEPKPEPVVYYSVITIRNVTADKTKAAAGETVNVRTEFGYDIIVADANGRQIAKITEHGSFVMPKSNVYVKAVQNETFTLMSNAWRHSYVYSYDSDMNRIAVNSDKKQGVIVIDLGADYAGREFTIFSGRKNTSVKVISGVLDKNGRYIFNSEDGRNYTLVIK